MQKLETNHRSWEHNSSHTLHLSSHTPLMFHDFTDKLREWSNLIEPGEACSCHHKLCVPTARDLSNFRCDLSSHTPWEQGFTEARQTAFSVRQMFGKQLNTICQLSSRQREFAYDTFRCRCT